MNAKRRKKNGTIFLSILAGAVLILSVILFALTMEKNSVQTATSSTDSSESSAYSADTDSTTLQEESTEAESSENGDGKEECYIIKLYNGKIGIFLQGETEPFQILDVDPNVLPESDQQGLKTGIEIHGAENLRQLIEDFDG